MNQDNINYSLWVIFHFTLVKYAHRGTREVCVIGIIVHNVFHFL